MNYEVNILKVIKGFFSGYSFRSKVEHDPTGDLAVIQMKDLEDNYSRIGDSCSMIDASSVPLKYLLQKGDVLFISKGANNYAVVYDLALPKAVAASAFFVLRPDAEKINPFYLAWYINQKSVQQYLLDNRAGTYIPNINKNTVLGIQIQLPEKKLQEKIVKIDFLRKQEYLLMNKLIDKRERLVSTKLLNVLN